MTMKKYALLAVALLTAGFNGVWANTADETVISFQDDNVKMVCIDNWDTDGDGELSKDEAAAVTSLGEVFSENAEVVSFKELQFFTGLEAIDDYAFSFCTSLKEVVLPEGIKTIGESAFDGCAALSGIIIPESVTNIGIWAFNGCAEIKTLSVPASVESIGNYAFGDCEALTQLSFSEGLQTIGEGAFQNCPLITEVTLPASLTSLQWGAFFNCSALVAVKVLFKTPINIDGATFSNRGNATLTVPHGCKEAFTNAAIWKEFMAIEEVPQLFIVFEDNAAKSVCIQHFDTDADGELSYDEAAQVKALGTVFEGNTDVRSFNELRFFTGLTEIKAGAFRGCAEMQTLTLPRNIQTIGEYAFFGCFSLLAVNVVEENNTYASVDGVLFTKDKKTLLTYPTAKGVDYAVPEGTLTVGPSAFYGCMLSNVYFPESLVSIQEEAFAESVTLQEVSLHEGFTTIAPRAFFLCSQLTEVNLPASLTALGEMAFGECNAITAVNSQMLSPMPIEVNTFSDVAYANALLHVSMQKDAVYMATEGWKLFSNIVDDLNRVDDEMIVSVSDVDIHAGSTSQVLVSLQNGNAVLNGYQFRLILPEGFSLAKNGNGDFQAELSNRYTDRNAMNLSIQESEGGYQIECRTDGSGTLTGAEGPLLSLTIQAEEIMGENDFMASIFNFSCSYIYEVILPAEDTSFAIHLVEYRPGDANHDDLVNVTDVMTVINHVLGRYNAAFFDEQADWNADSRVDVADAMGIVKYILTTSADMPASSLLSKSDGLQISADENGCLLEVENLGDYSAFQMEVALPEGASLRDVKLCEEASAGHSVRFNKLDNGHYKVVAFSMNGKQFRGDAARLLRFTVQGATAGKVALTDIQFTNADLNTVGFNDVQTATDGIGSVEAPSDDAPVYNLQGQKTNAAHKGVYIRNGKKFIRK